tara:strand:+ start:60 stop:836 length:777 start_codon:yes stop_codon:yes gene_type:complete
MDLGIRGKVAFITGGSRGLGKAAAISLAKEGAYVGICSRDEDTVADTIAELQSLGASAKGFVGDISDLSRLSDLHSKITKELGEIEILVNNVGGSKEKGDFTETPLKGFQETFDLNLFGSFELMKLVTPNMISQKWGRVINIASIWGREYGGNISYMSAKAALIAATKHAAVSLVQHGVLINSVAPGSVSHPQGSWEKFQNDNTKETVDDFIKNNLPMGKFGWAEPVGDLVAFLSSERIGFMAGSCIVIDGGQSYSML